jgi:hypothetical protein
MQKVMLLVLVPTPATFYRLNLFLRLSVPLCVLCG